MSLDVKRYLAPIHVETPNIEQDVNKLLSISPEVFRSLNNGTRKRIEVLAERFEFINHLEALIKFIEKEKTSNHDLKYNGDGKILVRQNDSFRLMDQDLSGADYDLQALIFYLLITCIDTIKGQPKYFNPFKWLLNNIDSFIEKNRKELEELIYESEKSYTNDYGLRKRFIAAFLNDLSDGLSEEIASR